MEAFKKNYIQNEIKRNFEEKENDLISGKNTMVGVNKFRFDEIPFEKTENFEDEIVERNFELLEDKRITHKFEI